MATRRWAKSMLLGTTTLMLALTAGCGDDGAAGSSCTVVEDPATHVVTISCEDGSSVDVSPAACTVTDDGAGTKTITCEDGTTATVTDGVGGTDGTDGAVGSDGTICTIADDGAGTKTITCDDGTTATVNDGRNGLDAGATRGLVATVVVTPPANGTHFVVGEAIVTTITFRDNDGVLLDYQDDLTSARFYMNGPRAVLLNKTPAALIGANVDRAVRPHHYIDLQTTTAPNLVVTDGVLVFTTEAVAAEDPGTYQIGIRATAPADLDRVFELADVQIGTATVEAEIVSGCANCHLGAENGQYYMHHIDPGYSAFGSPDIDSQPIETCRMCHSQDGYAAYRTCADGSRPPCADGVAQLSVPDSTMRRVHGVHNGDNLTSHFNIAEDGDFEDYRETEFPADIRNCATCHEDNSWAERPTRAACGACHDSLNFATGALDPPRLGDSCATEACPTFYTCNTTTDTCERSTHMGGAATDDSGCAGCHTATPGVGLSPVPDRHMAPVRTPEYDIALELTAPANGTHYVGGETPVLTITYTAAAGGAAVDPATVLTQADFQRAQLFVSGPRAHTQPVLTLAASGGYYRYVDYRVRTVAADEDPNITRSATDIEYQLADVAGLAPGTYTVMTRSRRASGLSYNFAMINFQVGTADEEARIATNCTDCHGDTVMHGYAPFDADACNSCHDYERQYGDTPIGVTDGWGGSAASGRANAGYGAGPFSRRIHGTHYGRYLERPDEVHASGYAESIIFPQDVRNCQKCHSDSMSYQEEPERMACLGCHDSDVAIAHATLNTLDPTPADPWNGDETETCVGCHGGGDSIGGDDDFTVEAVHNISSPYRPPYRR